ncbi:MAG: carboxypeptidase regulatory-like domain-containing protein [Pirellulales bacterium]|nr:carboxypeptidase regulatory-like domain-containing protein [Pirellulales bacterium]
MMKTRNENIVLVLFVSILSLLAGQVPADDNPVPVAVDVALQDNGVLGGRVINIEGNALTEAAIQLRQHNRVIAQGQTDDLGRFEFPGLRGGVYQVVVANSYATYRAWAPGTAPRGTGSEALLIVGAHTVRGQEPTRAQRLRRLLCNPLVIGAGVATAIAVPVAVDAGGGHHGAGVAGTVNEGEGDKDPPVTEPVA